MTNTAAKTAVQGGGILSAWRLTKDVRNASVDGLSVAGDLFGKLSSRCGWLLVFGLALEVGLALLNSPYGSPLDRWGSVGATAVVLVGVWGEVQFSHWGTACQGELTRRSNDRLTDAVNRLKTVQQLLGPRMLNPKVFAEALVGKPKAPVTIWYLPEASDGWTLAFNLQVALMSSGWEVAPPEQMPPIQMTSVPMHPVMAAGGQPSGITVVAPAGDSFDGTPYRALFDAIGKSTDRSVYGGSSQFFPVADGSLRVIIFAKPDPIFELPDWMTKPTADVTA